VFGRGHLYVNGVQGGRVLISRLSRVRTLVIAAVATVVFVGFFSRLPRLIAIELAFTSGDFRAGLTDWAAALVAARRWTGEPIHVFRLATLIDFLFIPAYATLLAAVYLRLSGFAGRWVVRSCMAAACSDVLENVGLLALTQGLTADRLPSAAISPALVFAMSSASALKWALLACVVAMIVRAFVSHGRGRVLALSRYSLLSIALGTIPLVAVAQGRDLLVALAADHAPISYRVFFYLALAVWGLSVWYWTRVVLDAAFASATKPEYLKLAKHLPRTLGAATLLLPALPLALAPNDLWVRVAMIAGCVFLAIAFVVFVANRRTLFKLSPEPAVEAFSIRAARRAPAARIAVISLVVSLTLFALFVFAPMFSGHWLGPVAILFIAAANLVFFGSLAVFASEVWGVSVDVLALACAAAFSFWNDNHDVNASAIGRSLPTLGQQYWHWRDQLPPGTQPPIVFLVAAEGGGIRAAYWAATVLGGLNEDGRQRFGNHLFAVSGISGGTLGAAVYAALRHDFPRGDVDLRKTAQRVLEHDFLSPTIAKLVTGDFLQWFLPLPIKAFDRSTAMEDSFKRAYERVTRKTTLGDAITVLTPDAATGVPALLMVTTIVESGARAIIAPLTWTNAQIPDATIYTCWVGDCAANPPMFAAPLLAQSIHNSARFTYISPAGLVRSITTERRPHVVDGGYFDPTGVDTLLDVTQALQSIDAETTFIPVYVTNGLIDRHVNDHALEPGQKPKPPAAPLQGPGSTPQEIAVPDDRQGAPIEILGELFAPVRTMLQTRGAHGDLAIDRQQRTAGTVTFGFCRLASCPDGSWKERAADAPMTSTDSCEEMRSQPPLGWQLSSEMTRRLDAYWTTCSANRTGAAAVSALLERGR
jgi:hypothetical protein